MGLTLSKPQVDAYEVSFDSVKTKLMLTMLVFDSVKNFKVYAYEVSF